MYEHVFQNLKMHLEKDHVFKNKVLKKCVSHTEQVVHLYEMMCRCWALVNTGDNTHKKNQIQQTLDNYNNKKLVNHSYRQQDIFCALT